MRVIFTEIAERTYDEVLLFLAGVWTQREMEVFIDDTENIVKQLIAGKYSMFQKSQFSTRSALIGKKHVRMYFRKEDENQIKVLLFFDMRQNPEKIIDLLK